jgi:2-keto-4-pentenoate hydratase
MSQHLARAWNDQSVLQTLSPELIPADADAAYSIQQEILAQQGSRIGWKVGANSPTGRIQGAAARAGVPRKRRAVVSTGVRATRPRTRDRVPVRTLVFAA